MEQEYSRWLSHVAESDLLSQLQTMSEQERREAFCCDLSFGTGGLRGIVGAGTNRMNIYTVRRATQGLANYLKAQKLPMSAAIAHDSRLYGRTFAETAACVLAANGIKVYLYPRLEPTPALSWAVRRYACGAGICITASHNPAQYNGYKVYGSDGCQITLDAANAIEAEIAVVDCFMDVQTCGYQEACADGRIESIPDSVLDAYINAVYAQRVTDIDCSGLRLVYTPLCGSGLECVQKLLDRLGVADVTVVPSQAKPDGKFPTCPYPNPEIRESMEEGLRLCREKQPELLIATDPDCDRCGVAARDQTGEYQLISGNEMGVLLLDFICKARLAANTMPHDPVAVTTVVSTGMADRLAAHYGVTFRRTLTGFKYIGEQIGQLEREGHPERFLFGFEESYGYLSGTHARDKDGGKRSIADLSDGDYVSKSRRYTPGGAEHPVPNLRLVRKRSACSGRSGGERDGTHAGPAYCTAKGAAEDTGWHANRGRLGLCGWSGRFATGRYVGVPTCKRSCSAPSFRHGAKTQTLHGSP